MLSGTRHLWTHTNVWWKCSRPCEGEEEDIGRPVDDVPPVELGERANEQRSDAKSNNVQAYAEDGNLMRGVEVLHETCLRERGLDIASDVENSISASAGH